YEKLLPLCEVRALKENTAFDAADFRAVGLAAAQLARWRGDHRRYEMLVQRYYPALLEAYPHYWPARLEMGLLLLEKFNAPEAARQFDTALRLNPRAADVHAARAQLAM